MTDEFVLVSAQETYMESAGSVYTSSFLKWKGIYNKNPIARSLVDAIADAVCASWRTYGKEGRTMATILDSMRGNGKQSFKLIVHNMVKTALIGGDSYAEMVYEDGKLANLKILPSDLVGQHVTDGTIVSYEFRGANTRKIVPEKIFHLAFDPVGATTHGESIFLALNDLFQHYETLMQTGSDIFETYTKPLRIFYVNTDSRTEVQKISASVKDINRTTTGDLFIPKGQIDKVERLGIPAGSTLDPAHWKKQLNADMFMGTRVAENILGIGTQNSEESARMQFAGFRQLIRWLQTWLSESLRWQVFYTEYPQDTPTIKWSFATEAQEEEYERNSRTLAMLSGLDIRPEYKQLIVDKILLRMELIPND